MGPEHPDQLTTSGSEVDPRLRLAIDASIGWYEEVFASHGIGYRIADGVWRSDGPAPPFHSALVTVEPGATVADVRARMRDPAWGGLKDSFATIDPTQLGMKLLFTASWIHRTPGPTVDVDPAWITIDDADGLARWNAHAEMDRVLLPALLERPGFTFLEHRAGGRPVAGAVVRADARVAELSNVHGVDGPVVDWTELAAVVGALHPGLPIVGFEAGDDLEAALAAGWQAVGPLRIWATAAG